jgi:hypothetical protein
MLNIKSISSILALSVLVGCSTTVTNLDTNDTTQILSSKVTGDFVVDYHNQLKRDNEEDPMQALPAQEIEGSKATSLPKSVKTKQLTYLTYEALDNNLYRDLNRVLNTLELIGSNDNINFVAQTDSWKENNTARYYLTSDKDMDYVKSQYMPLGSDSENSGGADVYKNAVNWGFSTYPAKMNWLNISTHGMGFASINSDGNPESDLSIIEFAQATKDGLKSKKLDLISFDACLMATVEVASELKDVSNIMVGSEDSTFYWGYGYYKTFSKVAQDPNMSGEEIARSLVLDVNNKGASNQTFTISATNLKKIDLLEVEVDKLSKALRSALPKHREDILRALEKSKDFVNAEGVPFRDLNRLISLIKENVNDNDVKSACDGINNALYKKGVILLSRQSKLEKDLGRGLSIYTPVSGKVSKLYRQTKFAKNTQWDEFLVDLNATIKPEQ